jgi:hypothetical protein
MTKEQEILERHLGCVLQTCYIKRNETAYRACLKAVKEALTIPVVVGQSEQLCYEDIESTKCLTCGDETCLDAECLQ